MMIKRIACAFLTLAPALAATEVRAAPPAAPSAAPSADARPTAPEPVPAAPAPAPVSPQQPVYPSAVSPPPPPPPATSDAMAPAEPEQPAPSWFWRPPLRVKFGYGPEKWQATIYGFVEADGINDSTRSYADYIGNALVARDDTYAGKVGRTQASIRNSRLGFELRSPSIGGVRPSAILESDFFGNQPATVSDAAYFNSPTFRIRHAYLKLESDVVDVWAGQTYYLFGWQNYFFPCSLEFLGLPNEAFGRTMQVRLGHSFKADAVSVDVAVAALSPAQRDSEIPDANAGVRLSYNRWKGISTPGNGGTADFPLSIGLSGTVRRFKVNAFTPPPPQSSNGATGWGLSVDALIPIIPAKDSSDRGNRLTLTGSFVVGTGIADLIGTGGNATFPTLPNAAQATPAMIYTPDIDNGLVAFDLSGVLHTINWQTFMVGLQYYVPPTGRVILSVNYTQSLSDNMSQLYPPGEREIGIVTTIAKSTRYADANVFWDVTPAVRVGASFQYTSVQYLDDDTPRNFRYMLQALYFF